MKEEEWRPVVGYEGLYEVSSKGRVKSLKRNTTHERILKPSTKPGDYKGKRVTLSKNGELDYYSVHRLEAIAFIPVPDHLKHIPFDDLEVNHMDENPENNLLENLEWCTRQYNATYGTAIERSRKKRIGQKRSEESRKKMSEAQKGKKQSQSQINKRVTKCKKPVIQLEKTGVIVQIFDCAKCAELYTGIIGTQITACCKHKPRRKSAGGYRWEYLTDFPITKTA